MNIPKRFLSTLIAVSAAFGIALSAIGQGQNPTPPDSAPAPDPAPPEAPAEPTPAIPDAPAPDDSVPAPAPDPPKPPVPPVDPPDPPKPPVPPVDPPDPPKPPVPPVDPPKPPVDPEEPDPKNPEPEIEEAPEPVIKERRIYIPFEELEAAFADEGRGVFLPYREFIELWSELTLEREKKEKEKPPTDALLSSATYTAKLEGDDTLAIEAKLTHESFKEDGWAILKLGAAGMNIAEAETGDSILRLAADGTYEMLIPSKGKRTATLKIFAKVIHGGGRHTARLSLPKSAVSRFTAVIPGRDWEFEIEPGAPFTTRDADPDSTELSFFFGGGDSLALTWQKKGGETKLTPLLFAETDLTSTVQAGALTTQVALNYRVLRAGVDEFKVSIPEPHEVLGVSGENIREWDIAKDGPNQVLTVSLHVPAKDSYALGVTLEAPIENLPAKLAVPAPEATGTLRQRGTLTLHAGQDLEVVLEKIDGLTQQGAAGANPQVSGDGEVQMLGRYRFLRFPFSAELAITRAEPVVEVNSYTRVTVEPDLTSFSARFDYNVKRVGIFSAQIAIPAGYENVEAAGDVVEDYTESDLPGGGGKVLDIKFTGRCSGPFSFTVTGQKPRKEDAEDLTVPTFEPVGANRHEAKVGIDIHTSLEPNTKNLGDLRQEDVSRLAQIIGGQQKNALTPLTLGFRYRGDQEEADVTPAVLTFKQKQPQVSADVRALVDVKEQLVRYRWRLNFAVQYAGIDFFIIAVPTAISDDLRLEDQSVKEIQKDYKPGADGDKSPPEKKDEAEGSDKVPAAPPSPPVAIPEGTTLWKVVLRDKKLGNFALDLSLEVPLDGLESGKETTVAVPQLVLRDIFQETGQIAVVKDGALEILNPTTKNLEPIDPKELRGDLGREGVFLAYKYKRHPIALTLAVTKNEFLKVPQALVTDAVLKSVVASDLGLTTEAVYWVNNNALQFLSLQLPEGGKIMSDVYVDGQPQQPMVRPGSEEIAIRLPSGQANKKFTVRFVYQIPSPDAGSDMGMFGSFIIPPPELLNTDVLRTTISLYLPTENVYTEFGGSMRRPVHTRGWNRFRSAFDWLVPAIGPDPERAPIAGWTNPPKLPSALADGFDVPVKGEGTQVLLYRLAGPAEVEVSYRSRGFSFFVEAFFFLAALIAGISLYKSTVGIKAAYFVVVGLGSLLIAGAINAGSARVWTAISLGAILAVIAWIVIGIYRKTRAAMERVESTPPNKPTDGGGGGTKGDGGDDGGGSSPKPTPQPDPAPAPTNPGTKEESGAEKKVEAESKAEPAADPTSPEKPQQIITDPFQSKPPKPTDKLPRQSPKSENPPPPAFPEVTPKKEDS